MAYLIPSNFGHGQGNDILSCVEGVDGRKYTMQLGNLTYTDYKNWGADRNHPVLFYQDKGSSEWCQYFPPVSPTFLEGKVFKNVGRIWSGSFYIFQQDAVISGYQFKRGQVLYLFVIPVFGSEANTEIFGYNIGKKWTVFWACAETIDDMVHKGGALVCHDRMRSDPRMVFEDGLLKFAANAGEQGDTAAFTFHVVSKLQEGNGTAGVSETAIMPADYFPMNPANIPQGASLRVECPTPMIVNGKRLFGFCSQLLGLHDAGDVWNSIVNNNWVIDVDSNWKATGKAQLLDIGYDGYALIAHNKDLMKPTQNSGYLNYTCFNWGQADLGRPGACALGYAYISGSYPFLSFSLDSNNKIRYDVSGMQGISIPQDGRIKITRGNIPVTEIVLNKGIYVDYDKTSDNEVAWRRTGFFVSKAYNEKLDIPFSAIKSIYVQNCGRWAGRIVIRADGFHDVCCGIYKRAATWGDVEVPPDVPSDDTAISMICENSRWDDNNNLSVSAKLINGATAPDKVEFRLRDLNAGKDLATKAETKPKMDTVFTGLPPQGKFGVSIRGFFNGSWSGWSYECVLDRTPIGGDGGLQMNCVAGKWAADNSLTVSAETRKNNTGQDPVFNEVEFTLSKNGVVIQTKRA